MARTYYDIMDDIKKELLQKGLSVLLVESIAVSTETSFVDTVNFQGFVALSDDLLVVYKNTFPFGEYSLLNTLNLKETKLLKSGKSLILRQYYVEIKNGKRKYRLTGISEAFMNKIVHSLHK